MKNKMMLGLWRYIFNVPLFVLEKQRTKGREKILANLAFMTPEHRRVHHHVVRELADTGKPLEAASLAQALHLELGRVKTVLDDLEEHMTFLFRNDAGQVVWAYPVTVEKTPHAVTLSTGQEIYAA